MSWPLGRVPFRVSFNKLAGGPPLQCLTIVLLLLSDRAPATGRFRNGLCFLEWIEQISMTIFLIIEIICGYCTKFFSISGAAH